MDKYKKIKIVGKGSFGFAVLVESRKSKKQFIIKIIDISKMEEKQIEEALNEVQVLKVMRYPYVVSYRQSFMEKMCLCIVMDYCEGGDMFNKIAKQKELGVLFSEHQILTWFVQMALALKHVHDRKILHRDLKTQNIFLTSKGEIKIGDFGIARVLQHTYDCANTAIGTPYYLSPEICQEKPYNQKSDIWSLGCILYELTTLNHAFDARDMKGLVQKILKGTYPPIPEVYSTDLKKLISELLIKDPNKRPSIRKILETPFLKARVNELFSSTLQLHESQLQKEGTSILELRNCEIPRKEQIESHKKVENSKKEEPEAQKKIEQRNFKKTDKTTPKIELISKQTPLAPRKKDQNQVSTSNLRPNVDVKSTYFGHKPTPQKYTKQNIVAEKRVLSREPHPPQSTPLPQQQRAINTPYSIEVSHRLNKQKEIDEDETLEEQGYNHLLNEMKTFIQGSSQHEQKEVQFAGDNVVPKFLNVNGQKFVIPGMNERDTTGSKIEALRTYLDKQIGREFVDAYRAICNEKDEDYSEAKRILGDKKVKFIPLIVQLIVCEDNYY